MFHLRFCFFHFKKNMLGKKLKGLFVKIRIFRDLCSPLKKDPFKNTSQDFEALTLSFTKKKAFASVDRQILRSC